jgi:predicted enzyme related to lactoylglutathione lyase
MEACMNRPIHFEIHAEDANRAIAFYTKVFGWKFSQWAGQPYWLVTTGEEGTSGINGGLMPRKGPGPADMAPVNAFVCTIDVIDLDAMVATAVAAGGVIALPKMPIPTMGWLAYCKDTEGNLFGMMQMDADAK